MENKNDIDESTYDPNAWRPHEPVSEIENINLSRAAARAVCQHVIGNAKVGERLTQVLADCMDAHGVIIIWVDQDGLFSQSGSNPTVPIAGEIIKGIDEVLVPRIREIGVAAQAMLAKRSQLPSN
jgi:hypothetical protein